METDMKKEEKKTLVLKYIGAFAILAVTIYLLVWMYRQAETDEAAKNSQTEVVTELNTEV